MKKLLWVSVSILFLVTACKTKKKQATKYNEGIDTVKEMPLPASDNPTKYDSLKNELHKRRKEKKKKK